MDGITIGYAYQNAENVTTETHQTYHFHPNDEIIIVHSGEVIAMTPNTYLSNKGPCVIFYKKNRPHAQINLKGTNYERYCIGFERNSIIELLPNLSLFAKYCKDDAFLLPLTAEQDKTLFTTATLIYNCSKKDGNQVKMKLLLSYMLTEITDIAGIGTSQKPVHFYLTEVAQYISMHLNEKLTIEDIASEFKISRTKLIRDFREFFSMSVLDYITMERLARAKEMLRRGETVIKVAESCGFVDSAYFIRVFKSHNGITPAQYRKKSSESPGVNESLPNKINI